MLGIQALCAQFRQAIQKMLTLATELRLALKWRSEDICKKVTSRR
jgi:hypothetical protein